MINLSNQSYLRANSFAHSTLGKSNKEAQKPALNQASFTSCQTRQENPAALRNALMAKNVLSFKGKIDAYDYTKYLVPADKKLISQNMQELSQITDQEKTEAQNMFTDKKALLKRKIHEGRAQLIADQIAKLASSITDVRHDKKAVIVTGAASAGKSSLIEMLMAEGKIEGALFVDQDIAKQNLPKDNPVSAKAKKFGSALIGSKGSELLNEIIEEESSLGTNICMPTGCNNSDLTNVIDTLSKKGYEIELIQVKVDPETATKRLMGRIKNGRFTKPEKVMAELKQSDEIISGIFENYGDSIKNYTVIDNSPPRPDKPLLISSHGIGIDPKRGKGGLIERLNIVQTSPC